MGKPKAVNFELIAPHTEPYLLLDEIIKAHHDELMEAGVVLAWRKALKSDVDGRLILGKCIKVSDMHKELVEYDFIILLNKEVWEDPEFTVEKKRALIDHELCHAAPAVDKETDEQKTDSRGRLVWRIRKHDIEEFRGIVERHGCYKNDLERFAEALLKSKQPKLAMAAA